MSTRQPTTTDEPLTTDSRAETTTDTATTRDRSRRSGGAPMLFSPTSSATAGQFDTTADEP